MNYLRQKATPWVSISVLVGGFMSAGILFFLARVEANYTNLGTISDEELFSQLDKR